MTTYGFDEAQKKLTFLTDRLRNLNSETYQAIGRVVEESIAQNFAEQGRPPWQPRKDDKPHPILNKTGALKDAALRSTKEWKTEGKKKILEILTPLYGLFHQYQTRRESLPVRKFVAFTQAEIDQITRILEGNDGR
jgi:phage gpG-like protein